MCSILHLMCAPTIQKEREGACALAAAISPLQTTVSSVWRAGNPGPMGFGLVFLLPRGSLPGRSPSLSYTLFRTLSASRNSQRPGAARLSAKRPMKFRRNPKWSKRTSEEPKRCSPVDLLADLDHVTTVSEVVQRWWKHRNFATIQGNRDCCTWEMLQT